MRTFRNVFLFSFLKLSLVTYGQGKKNKKERTEPPIEIKSHPMHENAMVATIDQQERLVLEQPGSLAEKIEAYPIRFLTFTGALQSDQTVLLKWDAEITLDHRYFQIDESSDGVNFTVIGTTQGAVSEFVDHLINAGNNYYRIRAINVNGKVSYSPVINVQNKIFTFLVYPNPASDLLHVRLATVEAGIHHLIVTDMMGNVLYTQEQFTDKAGTETQFSIKSWLAGVYLIKVFNDRNELISYLRFIKH